MMEDPIFYIMIALAVIFALTTILLCIGCKKSGSAKMNTDIIDFLKGCSEMQKHLDKFENGLNQFPNSLSEAVKPVISEYIREQVEICIKEALNSQGCEVKPDDVSFGDFEEEPKLDMVQCYKDYFFSEPYTPFLSKDGKQVTIREEYHNMISALVNTSDGECRSIYHYVDNVLKNHFLAYGDTIRSILSGSTEKVKVV